MRFEVEIDCSNVTAFSDEDESPKQEIARILSLLVEDLADANDEDAREYWALYDKSGKYAGKARLIRDA